MLANCVTGFVSALWAFWIWLGIGAIRSIAAQHAPGYPNSGQIFFYIALPALIITVLALFAVVLNFVWRSPSTLAVVAFVGFLLLFPYLLMSGGGM
jgi:dolichyl-phosphate-mannose--protein O-mannosyl transferase